MCSSGGWSGARRESCGGRCDRFSGRRTDTIGDGPPGCAQRPSANETGDPALLRVDKETIDIKLAGLDNTVRGIGRNGTPIRAKTLMLRIYEKSLPFVCEVSGIPSASWILGVMERK